MLKIFVTGDNHIGKNYDGYPQETRNKILLSRLDALTTMVNKANEERCGLFAVTGDLFEDVNIPSKKDIEAVVKALKNFKGNVVIIPGNHDYYNENSAIWNEFFDAKDLVGADNLILMCEEKPYPFTVGDANVLIYPAVCKSVHSEKNGLGWIKSMLTEADAKNADYHIGMAHGSIDGFSYDKEGAYYPMTKEELNKIDVDVWLLGHAHVPFPRGLTMELTKCSDRIFNPGTHVQTDSETDTDGLCFILEIDEDKTIRAKKFVSGNIFFRKEKVDISAGNLEENLTNALKDLHENTIVNLTLTGEGTDEERSKRNSIVGNVFDQLGLIHGKTLRDEWEPAIDEKIISDSYGEDSFPAKLLMKLLDDHKTARMAKDLLEEIKEGKK